MTASPFAQAADLLIPLGFNLIPLLPPDAEHAGRGKAPGAYVGGRWGGLPKWQQYRDKQPSKFETQVWRTNWPDANAGVVLGSPAGPELAYYLIAVDIDTTDPDAYDEIVRACPPSPMTKRGAKGLTLFYCAPADIKSRGYKIGGKTALDLLTGNQTRQTVVPPSVHPEGPTYVWVTGPVPAADLPLFDEDALAVLEETLESLGWGAESAVGIPISAPKPAPTPRDPDDEPTVWRDLNDEALANLAAWIPALDLYGLRPARGGYEAVATWRESNAGRPVHQRKKNLKIHPDGIRDMGDRGYSALDLVQAARACDLEAAFEWLTTQLGRGTNVVPLPMKVITAKNLPKKIQGQEITAVWFDEMAAAPPDDGELPDHLTRNPGLLGLLTDYVAATARRPSRVMALGAALTIVGTVAGRQFSGPTRTGLHLYVMPLARTSAGKDHPLKMIMRVMHAANLGQHVGPSEFISMPAAIKFIGRSPLAVCPMDEFGSFLKRINSRRASGFEGAISGILRTAWGSSFQPMTTPEWAHVESRTIFAPALSLYGASTPEEFYGSLASADTTNGLMNRFLVLETKRRAPEQDPTMDPSVTPDEITAALRAIYYARGELFAASLNQADQDRSPSIVAWASPKAAGVYAEFGRYVEQRADDDRLAGAFLGRTVEMAQRLATIRALGREGGIAQVSVEDMEWGRDVALWSAETMIRGAIEHMAENDQQQAMKLVLGIIREAKQITRNELVRQVYGRLDTRTLESIVKGLLDGDMVWEATQTPGQTGGRPRKVYVFGPPADAA